MRKRLFLLSILLSVFCLWPALPAHTANSSPTVYTYTIEGTVTAGTSRYIIRGLEQAARNQADAVIIYINTPGGLVSSTLEMIQAISASPVPVITYVQPQGAISASAGTFLLISGHVAAMAPATSCGAAMPVNIVAPGETPKAADQKTINYLAGHMKSLARERGRPADLAERFVKENLTLDSQEALQAGVVEYLAADTKDLLRQLDGQPVKLPNGKKLILNTASAQTKHFSMNESERFISIISDPMLTMILLTIGIYGLIIGFSSPGFFFPEILGAISLVLGLFGLGLFEVNLAAALLILFGVGLLVAELFTPTYGVLGISGVISVVLGILFFPVEPLMPHGWAVSFRSAALGIALVGVLLVIWIVVGLVNLRKHPPVHGNKEFNNLKGITVQTLNPAGLVKVQGEIWQAVSFDGQEIPAQTAVQVRSRQGLTLVVQAQEEDHPSDN